MTPQVVLDLQNQRPDYLPEVPRWGIDRPRLLRRTLRKEGITLLACVGDPTVDAWVPTACGGETAVLWVSPPALKDTIVLNPAPPTVPCTLALPAADRGVPARVKLRAHLLAQGWKWSTTPYRVSVLVGSYNRRKMLEDFVTSVRANLSTGYEIIVADGGSTDGTLEWLAAQADCRVVHAGLTGAIDAFNLGYEASVGRYVFYANDDTTVVGDGLVTALAHLEKEAACPGIAFEFKTPVNPVWGCPRFNTEYPHPNVALLRREVVEACVAFELGALWGDEAHRVHKTYFGDTYLGVVLAKLGYKLGVSPAHRVIDHMPPDALRDMNKSNAREWRRLNEVFDTMSGRSEGVHPRVSVGAWQDALVPYPGRLPARSPISAGPPERILVAVAGTKNGTMVDAARALTPWGESQCRVVYLHEPHDWTQALYTAAKELQPTIVWLQMQQETHAQAGVVSQLRQLAPEALVVTWNGDLTVPHGGYYGWQDTFSPLVDLALVTNCTHPAHLMRQGCPAAGYLPIGWDSPTVSIPSTGVVEDASPVVFTGTGYPRRVSMFAELRHLFTIYGHSWPTTWRVGAPIEMSQVGALYRSAVGVVCSSATKELRRYTSDRLKRVLGCGGLAIVEEFSDYEGLGLRDGVNCLVWQDSKDLASLLKLWVSPEKVGDRQRIRQAGYQLANTTMRWTDTMEHLMASVRLVRAHRR